MNQPTRGAVPAFFGPPHVGLFTIDAALRAILLPDIYTILYTTKIFYFYNIGFLFGKEKKEKII
jgi:hypothetical protein